MKRLFIFFVACFVLLTFACKSGNQETTSVSTSTDTTAMQATPPPATEEAAKGTEAAPTNDQMTSKSGTASSGTAATGTTAAANAPASTAPGLPDANGYYTMPEKKPLYPGGEPAFNKYLADNLKYPADARKENIQGTVYASLLVDEHGKIVDASIVSKPLGYGLEAEVLRVIKNMPQWSPGEFDHHAVKTKFTLPVVFKLK